MRSRIQQLLQVTDGVWCFRQRSYVCCSNPGVDDDGIVLVDARASLAALLELPVRYRYPGGRTPLTENVAAQSNSLWQRVLADPPCHWCRPIFRALDVVSTRAARVSAT